MLAISSMSSPTVQRTAFGRLDDGTPVDLISIGTPRGAAMRVMTYGGTILSLTMPDRHGQFEDIVLGFETLDQYLDGSPYFGATVGRFANRIALGRFMLDERPYQLTINNGANHLHGGQLGLDSVVWDALTFAHDDRAGVILTHQSPDGIQGYPGTLDLQVTYTLTSDHALRILYEATTDRPTPVNLTHHSYFNLSGPGTDILGHELTIHADVFTPVTDALIPTGELRPVTGTPFDFRKPTRIGARIHLPDDQLRHAGGYDHNFVLGLRPSPLLRSAATLVERTSGRTIDVSTTEPGIQLYSGNFLNGSLRGKGGQLYTHRSGLCLETQHFPDSPNHPAFPSTILRPGEQYRSETMYQFGVITD